MVYIIYPKCSADDIRKRRIDLSDSFNNKDYKPQKGNEVCAICAPEKRVIANGNSFDNIFAGE